MDNTKINKIMNTAWVRKYMAEFMSQRPHTKSFISQDDTECSDHEDFNCITILRNDAQYAEFQIFSTEWIQKFRPDIRAGCMLIKDVA